MAKYYRRPDGLYETSRTVNGKRIKFRGRTCQEVDRKILEFNTQQKRGRKVPVIVDEWYRSIEKDVAYSTYKTYGFSAERIKAAFCGYAADVRPLDIKRYIAQFEQKGYAKSTVGVETAVLRLVFSYAVVAGDIDISPAAEVKYSKNLPVKKRFSLTEEQEAKVEACRTGDGWMLGLMLLYTGCRRGELLALNWQDIDREAGVIHITKKLNYAFGNTPKLEDRLKSDNGRRDIPLLQPLADALPRNRIGPIFTGADGKYLTACQLNRLWKNYCKDAGLTEWDYDEKGKAIEVCAVTPHCFRHSYATICCEAGVDPKSAASFLGDTEGVAQAVYTHVRATHCMTSAEKINAYLEMRAYERRARNG